MRIKSSDYLLDILEAISNENNREILDLSNKTFFSYVSRDISCVINESSGKFSSSIYIFKNLFFILFNNITISLSNNDYAEIELLIEKNPLVFLYYLNLSRERTFQFNNIKAFGHWNILKKDFTYSIYHSIEYSSLDRVSNTTEFIDKFYNLMKKAIENNKLSEPSKYIPLFILSFKGRLRKDIYFLEYLIKEYKYGVMSIFVSESSHRFPSTNLLNQNIPLPLILIKNFLNDFDYILLINSIIDMFSCRKIDYTSNGKISLPSVPRIIGNIISLFERIKIYPATINYINKPTEKMLSILNNFSNKNSSLTELYSELNKFIDKNNYLNAILLLSLYFFYAFVPINMNYLWKSPNSLNYKFRRVLYHLFYSYVDDLYYSDDDDDDKKKNKNINGKKLKISFPFIQEYRKICKQYLVSDSFLSLKKTDSVTKIIISDLVLNSDFNYDLLEDLPEEQAIQIINTVKYLFRGYWAFGVENIGLFKCLGENKLLEIISSSKFYNISDIIARNLKEKCPISISVINKIGVTNKNDSVI